MLRTTNCWRKQLVTVALLCVTFFFAWDKFTLVSLFYSKCYVTMFCNRIVAFSYRYWGKFPLKNEKKLSRIIFFSSKTLVFIFVFFLHFSNRLFFWGVSFRYILYFFWFVNKFDRFCWFCDLLFFIVMKNHNRVFWIGDFCFIPAGRSRTIGVVT